MTDTVQRITETLQALSPQHLAIEDDSHKHAGHAGNTGGGHYNVLIVSNAFDGLSLIQRHKLVYQTLEALMQTQIHALSINAKTPAEYHS
jgi:BolA protein